MRSRAELDRVGDRRVVGHAAVHQRAVLPAHRRQNGGDRGAGHDGLERPGRCESRSSSPVMTSTATTCSGIGSSSSALVLDVACDQPAQAGVGDQVVAGAEEAEQPGERVEREDLSAPQSAPDARRARRRSRRSGVARR